MTFLVIRFQSLGNVAMSVPIISSLSARYPQHRFVVVARHALSAMFYGLPNVVFHETSLQGGGFAMLSLFRELKSYAIDAVIDLQDNSYSYILRTLYRIKRLPIYVIDKGALEKRTLIRKGHKQSVPLISEFERYAQVFRMAGLESDTRFEHIPVHVEVQEQLIERFGNKEGRWIGIAPFAKNQSNILPNRVIKDVIAYFSHQANTRLYLFGAGLIEGEMLRQWASIFPNVVSVAGQIPLEQELELIRMQDVMVGMDSANQHLSALVGTPTISIWCGTHPFMGFAAWRQDPDYMLQTNFNCRPCCENGTNICKYRNFACKNISAEQIIQLITKKLNSN